MEYLLIIAFVQISAALHAIKKGYPYQFIALLLVAPIIGPGIYLWLEYSHHLFHFIEDQVERYKNKKKDPYVEISKLFSQVHSYPTIENRHRLAKLYMEIGQYDSALQIIESLLQGYYADCPLLLNEKDKILTKMEKETRKSA